MSAPESPFNWNSLFQPPPANTPSAPALPPGSALSAVAAPIVSVVHPPLVDTPPLRAKRGRKPKAVEPTTNPALADSGPTGQSFFLEGDDETPGTAAVTAANRGALDDYNPEAVAAMFANEAPAASPAAPISNPVPTEALPPALRGRGRPAGSKSKVTDKRAFQFATELGAPTTGGVSHLANSFPEGKEPVVSNETVSAAFDTSTATIYHIFATTLHALVRDAVRSALSEFAPSEFVATDKDIPF